MNKVPVSQCNTGLQYETFPTSNNNGPDFSFRTCFLKYAGPRVYAYGAAYALGKTCNNSAFADKSICYPMPVSEGVTATLWYKDTILARCGKAGSTQGAATCYWSPINLRSIPYGATLVCSVMGSAKIAYEMYTAGSCGSRQ